MRALFLIVLLAGCAAKPSLQSTTRCPPLAAYAPEFQAAVADDLRAASWRVRKMMEDYGALRAQCRALE